MRILAVGAHPDDIELGAAGLVAKAVELGHRVLFLVLTDEDGTGAHRRVESVRAAAELGVSASDVIFAGFRDGHLRADGESVDETRRLLSRHRVRPDLVVTHTQADSHNDHVEAHRLTHAVFRDTAFLHFSIHISAEIDRFSPKVFVELDPRRLAVKDAALRRFPSQKARVDRLDLAKYEASLGQFAGLDRAEGFEVGVQYGTHDVWRKTLGLSDSAFHRFWAPVVADGTITLLYGATDHLTSQALLQQNIAHDKLRQTFVDCWPPPYPLREHYANTDQALDLAAAGSLVVTGSPASNRVAADLHRSGRITWQVNGGRELGHLARIANPYKENASLVVATGTTAVAVRAGLELLADPGRAPDLFRTFDEHLTAQLTYAIDPSTGDLRLVHAQHDGATAEGEGSRR